MKNKPSCKLATKGMLCLLWVFLTLIPGSGASMAAGTESLRVGLLSQPESLNYFSATDAWSRKVLLFFQMPLFVRDPRSGEMMPWLAEAMPEISHDPATVTIRLREIVWDDGSPVTAGDLAFTVKVIQEFRVPAYVERWMMVEKAEVLDPKTVRFTLKGPSPEFLNRTLLTSFVQEKEWAPVIRKIRASDDPLTELLRFHPNTPASNGPFSLTKYRYPYFMVLKKNPRFFASGMDMAGLPLGPHLDELILDFHPTGREAVDDLAKGEIDFYWGDVPLTELERLRRDPRISLFTTQSRGYDYLVFNLQQAPFQDLAFRRAIALLIDREEIIKSALDGNGVPAYSVIPPVDRAWLNPEIPIEGKGLSRKDRIKSAQNVLRQAGYSWKDGALILPNGTELKRIEMLTTCAGYRPYRMEAALLIRKWLAGIGIAVDVRMRPLGTVIRRLTGRSYDLALLGWGHLPDDPGYLSTFFGSGQAGAGGKNYSGFRNADFDALAEKLTRETDFAGRLVLVYEMQKLIADEIPSIPLYSHNIIEAANTGLFSGWVERPGGIGNLWSFLSLQPRSRPK